MRGGCTELNPYPTALCPVRYRALSPMKLAIFDKDNTLTTPKSGARFVQNPEDQMLLPGVAEGIAALAANGWAIAIASNQGGVAAGHKSEDDALSEMAHCLKLLPQISVALFCPDFEGWICIAVSQNNSKMLNICRDYADLKQQYRKPGRGMLMAAQRFLGGDFEEVFFVGDRPEDEQAAAAAGVPFLWANEWRATWAEIAKR